MYIYVGHNVYQIKVKLTHWQALGWETLVYSLKHMYSMMKANHESDSFDIIIFYMILEIVLQFHFDRWEWMGENIVHI